MLPILQGLISDAISPVSDMMVLTGGTLVGHIFYIQWKLKNAEQNMTVRYDFSTTCIEHRCDLSKCYFPVNTDYSS